MNYIIKNPQQLGPLIKALRKEKGVTQASAGSQAYLNQNAVSLIESDPGSSSVQRLFNLMHALDIEFVIRKREL